MKVSVVIPVYNKGPFLKECLDSVFAQTFPDFEVIAVDDCSTDNCLEILRSCHDPRLRVVQLERNMGPAGAAQRGMDLAQGEYIVRMDADDMMFPDRIGTQVRFMDAHPEVGVSGGQVILFGDESITWRYSLENEACKADLIFGVPISQGASILRASVLERTGVRYADEWPRVAEDWLFMIELSPHTEFGNVDVPLIHYRRGAHNIKHTQNMDVLGPEVLRSALPRFGLEPTEENIRFHNMNIPVLPSEVNAALIRNYRRWLNELEGIQRAKGSVSPEAMHARIASTWNRLFYHLPAYGFAPALEHFRSSAHWPMDRVIYLFKVRLRAWVTAARNFAKGAALNA